MFHNGLREFQEGSGSFKEATGDFRVVSSVSCGFWVSRALLGCYGVFRNEGVDEFSGFQLGFRESKKFQGISNDSKGFQADSKDLQEGFGDFRDILRSSKKAAGDFMRFQ